MILREFFIILFYSHSSRTDSDALIAELLSELAVDDQPEPGFETYKRDPVNFVPRNDPGSDVELKPTRTDLEHPVWYIDDEPIPLDWQGQFRSVYFLIVFLRTKQLGHTV